MKTVEYTVKPETRYVVWKHETTETGGSVGKVGTYDSETVAELAARAFATVDRKGGAGH